MGSDLIGAVMSALPWIIVLVVALSVHESAHAWTADRLGDPTARSLGRISMNPLVHADPWGTFLVPLMLAMFSPFVVGWAKPVPVNVARLRNPKRDYMWVAAAGPLSNIAMAALLLVLLLIVSVPDSGELLVWDAVRDIPKAGVLPMAVYMAYTGIWINVLLAIFNMIPVFPLDGAAVLRGLVPEWLGRPLDQLQSFGIIILIALLYFGIPGYLFFPVIEIINSILV